MVSFTFLIFIFVFLQTWYFMNTCSSYHIHVSFCLFNFVQFLTFNSHNRCFNSKFYPFRSFYKLRKYLVLLFLALVLITTFIYSAVANILVQSIHLLFNCHELTDATITNNFLIKKKREKKGKQLPAAVTSSIISCSVHF